MKQKEQIKIIRPSEALRSLSSFNENVMALVQVCELLISHNAVDPKVKDPLEERIQDVKKFYIE